MRRALLPWLVAVGLLSACHDPVRPQSRDLDSAVARWSATRPANNSYQIDQRVSCFCIFGGNPFRVTVTSGTITRVVDLSNGQELDASQFSRFRTVDQLFAEVRSALQLPGTLRNVQYDAQRGYPTTVSLDPVKNAVDDEVAYITEGFRGVATS